MTDIMNSLKAGINAKQEEDAKAKEEVFGLGLAEDAMPIDTIKDAIGVIKSQFEQESIPYVTIEVGLREVMKLLKKYEDIVLELEPEAIETIVVSYMALSDEEVKTIFDKASKKKKTVKKTKAIKEIEKLAQERKGDTSALEDFDFDSL